MYVLVDQLHRVHPFLRNITKKHAEMGQNDGARVVFSLFSCKSAKKTRTLRVVRSLQYMVLNINSSVCSVRGMGRGRKLRTREMQALVLKLLREQFSIEKSKW